MIKMGLALDNLNIQKKGFECQQTHITNVAPGVILEGEDYGLKVSINIVITGATEGVR
jgi:hypothetical protein